MNELSTLTNSTVQALIELLKPSAPQMTCGLKRIGNGNMLSGICYMFETGREIGIQQGYQLAQEVNLKSYQKGLVTGTILTTLAFGTVVVVSKIAPNIKKKIQETKESSQRIIDTSEDDNSIQKEDYNVQNQPNN